MLTPGLLQTIRPSLRAYDINPVAADVNVMVTVDGLLVAEVINVAGGVDDMDDLGEGGFATRDLPVAFQVNLCCYNCATANVSASITDGFGRQFAGELMVQLARDECPAPDICCGSADECPGSLAQVCQ